MGPGALDRALSGIEIPDDPRVLVGIRGFDDAGVYVLDEATALIQTVDFFTPVVDDPWIFGKAAAANALSDVYAMGGRPLTAMNIVCFPSEKLGVEPLQAILAGGLETLKEAGAALVGGHSVEDSEPKYGLAVTGIAHPRRIMTNAGLLPGDRLILTKALGTGVLAAAIKGELADAAAVDAMIRSMCELNKTASEVALSFGLRACTDVTGFGLAGHLAEMARASRCRLRIRADAAPLLEGAFQAASMGLIPRGCHSNRDYFKCWVAVDQAVSPVIVDLIFDPQTSGGLILAVPSSRSVEVLEALLGRGVLRAAEIGEVLASDALGAVEIVPGA
jgi:selenide,water dikinase